MPRKKPKLTCLAPTSPPLISTVELTFGTKYNTICVLLHWHCKGFLVQSTLKHTVQGILSFPTGTDIFWYIPVPEGNIDQYCPLVFVDTIPRECRENTIPRDSIGVQRTLNMSTPKKRDVLGQRGSVHCRRLLVMSLAILLTLTDP